MKKIVLFLAAAGLSFAAKSYDVTFGVPAVLGSIQLPPGQYQVKFEGSKVTLTNAKTGKSVDTFAAVQAGDRKFSDTIVQSKRVDGKDLVDEIQIGGTQTALEFKH